MRTELNGYSLKARFYPALLTVMPAAAYLFTVWQTSILPAKLWPVGIAFGLPFFLSTLVRSRGKRAEQKLVKAWGGLPTSQLLRHSDHGNHLLRERRRSRLEALLGHPLPSPEEELADPAGADFAYETATAALRGRRHRDTTKIQVLHAENIEYGFRRNLYGLKPIALVILAACFSIDFWLLFEHNPAWQAYAAVGIHVTALVLWTAVIRPRWVRESADSYADALFNTLESREPEVSP